MKHLFKSLSVIALGLAALQAEAKFKVVTTFTVIQDIAQNVAGDAIGAALLGGLGAMMTPVYQCWSYAGRSMWFGNVCQIGRASCRERV